MKLKHNTIILLSSQEELNMFAEVVEVIELDSLHVDEPYVAFIEEVVCVMPQSQIEEGHRFYGVKPRKFMSWYRSVK